MAPVTRGSARRQLTPPPVVNPAPPLEKPKKNVYRQPSNPDKPLPNPAGSTITLLYKFQPKSDANLSNNTILPLNRIAQLVKIQPKRDILSNHPSLPLNLTVHPIIHDLKPRPTRLSQLFSLLTVLIHPPQLGRRCPKPRVRIRDENFPSGTVQPKPGLPEDIYRPKWLGKITAQKHRGLQIQPPLKIERIARRLRKAA